MDVDEANALLPDNLRLVDNGDISPKETLLGLEGPPHAYHLIPRGASKAEAVAAHMRARGYAREECIAVGDSVEDMGVAEHVGRFFLVANAKVAAAGRQRRGHRGRERRGLLRGRCTNACRVALARNRRYKRGVVSAHRHVGTKGGSDVTPV